MNWPDKSFVIHPSTPQAVPPSRTPTFARSRSDGSAPKFPKAPLPPFPFQFLHPRIGNPQPSSRIFVWPIGKRRWYDASIGGCHGSRLISSNGDEESQGLPGTVRSRQQNL